MRYPFIIITLNDSSTYELLNSLIDFSCTENLKNSNVDFTLGIFVQSATINFYDKDNVFHKLINNNTQDVFYRAHVDIYVHNTTDNSDELLGNYILDTIDIQGSDSHISISCIDNTYLLDVISINNLNVASRTVDEFLSLIFTNYLNATFTYLDNDTKDRCVAITINDSYLLKQTCKEALNKICAVGLLNIIYDKGMYVVGRCL